ncbi:MAG TPA: DUF1385 domain-containing protein [Symbiobacteriaceae bacterium]|nr:DUF1385 domain-containing protein [Symbiobacteriaceae bacterium]
MGEQQFNYGGQAVIEGVMMRGPTRVAIAVRRPDGEIAIRQQDVSSIMQRYPVLKLPVVRGMVAMVETLSIGIGALMYSANQAMPDEEQLSKKEMTLTTVLGLVLALGVFVAIPTLITHWVKGWAQGSAIVNIVEGVIRLAMFIGYMVVISLLKDIQRVYQYHGAEHKVINTYEAGAPLTVDSARTFSREHKRCGTSFLLYVVVLSIVLFSIFKVDNVWLRIVVRLALMPVVAGISYEFLRLMGRYNNQLTLLLSRPGMWLQGLTTREPDDSQLEVAIAAFETARGYGLPG